MTGGGAQSNNEPARVEKQYDVDLGVRETWTAKVTAPDPQTAREKALNGEWDDVIPNSDRRFVAAKVRRRDA